MSKNTLLSNLINYISANSSGNVVVAAPTSGLALDVTGTGRFTGALTGTSATFTGTSASSVLTLANSSGGTKADFTITENTGLIINSYEGASARSINLQVAGASALSIATSGAATFSSSVTIEGNNSTIRSGNEIRFNRADNAIYTRLYDGGGASGFVIDNRNGDGFNFQSAGTPQFRIAATGAATFSSSVTATAPSSGVAFQVNGRSSDNIGQILFYANNGTTLQNYIQSRPAYLAINTETNTPMYFGTNVGGAGGTVMTLTGDGKVGIGTTAPVQIAHIQASGTSYLHIGNNATGATSSDGCDIGYFSGETLLNIVQRENDGIAFSTNGNPAMRITNLGALAINMTSSPYGNLSLKSNSTTPYAGFNVYATGNGNFTYMNHDNNVGIIGTEFGVGGTGHTPLTFQVGGSERMRITSGGAIYSNFGSSGTTGRTDLTPNLILEGKSTEASGRAGISILANGTANSLIMFGASGTMNTDGFITYENSTRSLSFGTADGTRMRITSGGDVLINGSTINQSASLGFGKDGAGIYQYINRSVTTGAYQIEFRNPNGLVGYISTSGSTTTFSTSSDYRLKQDLKSFNGLEVVSKINAYDYEWKSDNTRSYGVLAHELKEILPYAVMGDKDGEIMQGVDYSKIVPVMVQAIKDLKKEIDLLKQQ
jgi:hypothetical protein